MKKSFGVILVFSIVFLLGLINTQLCLNKKEGDKLLESLIYINCASANESGACNSATVECKDVKINNWGFLTARACLKDNKPHCKIEQYNSQYGSGTCTVTN